MSSALVWELVKKNNCFIAKNLNGTIWSKEPCNLYVYSDFHLLFMNDLKEMLGNPSRYREVRHGVTACGGFLEGPDSRIFEPTNGFLCVQMTILIHYIVPMCHQCRAGIHSYKYSGIANSSKVGVSEEDGAMTISVASKKDAHKLQKTAVKKNARRSAHAAGAVARKVRPDLVKAAKAKASAVARGIRTRKALAK